VNKSIRKDRGFGVHPSLEAIPWLLLPCEYLSLAVVYRKRLIEAGSRLLA
jgi:hypothetical protein